MATESEGSSGGMLECPFCDFKDHSDYELLLHVELSHSETGESPFAVKDEVEAKAQQAHEMQEVQEVREDHSPRKRSSRRKSSARESTSRRLVPAEELDSSDETRSVHELEFVACPYHCGEHVLANDLQYHTDFHVAEEMANHDTAAINMTHNFTHDISDALRHHDRVLYEVQTPTKEKHWTTSLKDMFSKHRLKLAGTTADDVQVGEVARLGKTELGPYANERRMPNWLIRLLEEGAKVTVTSKISHDGRLVKVETISNETPNLVPVLARLSKVDDNVKRAFYCNPFIRHVAKLPNEGGFCGYRNIQMLVSYIRDAQASGHEHFDRKRLPSILKLQDMIERAWDQGFNSSGRIETGGIRMTRKYIGTPEAQALLLSLGIPAEALAFSSRSKRRAYTAMMEAVCKHFDDGSSTNSTDKVIITDKPPLFFQHQGHSMTVVGVELDTNCMANLVVFDPMYNPARQLKSLALNNRLTFTSAAPEKLMKPHRRDERYLGRYKDFEMIRINGAE